MSRKRLPKKPSMVVDEKLVNLLRFYQMCVDELEKPQKKLLYLSSMMGMQNDIGEMIVERLMWLFHDQYSREKFVWGALKEFKKLPDKMPVKLQHAVKRFKERNGL